MLKRTSKPAVANSDLVSILLNHSFNIEGIITSRQSCFGTIMPKTQSYNSRSLQSSNRCQYKIIAPTRHFLLLFVLCIAVTLATTSMISSTKYIIRSATSMWHGGFPCRKIYQDQIRISRAAGFNTVRKSGRGHKATVLAALDDSSSFYATTPIYYVNGDPHLGHAYTSVMTDILARFAKLDGKDTFFLTGTDEHGQKVQQSAALAGKSPIQFADDVSAKFRHLVQTLNCGNNDFIRTTEERHKRAVQALWDQLKANDQIYLGAYEGWYSIRDEAFYTEAELIDGKAPTGAPVEWVKEESYFFRLSQWTQKLLDFYEQHPDFIAPKSRRNEVLSFVSQEGGLKDLSISRTTFSWGIPVASDPAHVVYVWLDALTNYLSAVGYPDINSDSYKKFWPASVHVVGKDILRFHAIFWPAFLLAAGIEPPKVNISNSYCFKHCTQSLTLMKYVNPSECLLMAGGRKMEKRCPSPSEMYWIHLNWFKSTAWTMYDITWPQKSTSAATVISTM